MSNTSNRYPQELKERSIRLVGEVRDQYGSEWEAIESVASKLGIASAEVRKLRAECGSFAGPTKSPRLEAVAGISRPREVAGGWASTRRPGRGPSGQAVDLEQVVRFTAHQRGVLPSLSSVGLLVSGGMVWPDLSKGVPSSAGESS